MKRIHLSLLLLALASVASSEPRQWDTQGVPVRAASLIDDFSSATREDGTTLVVWAQSVGYEPVVLGQLLSPAGLPQWADGGITLAYGERRAGYPVAVSVGNEWVILWQDAEITANGDPERGWIGRGSLRLIRIDDNGNPVWTGGAAGTELAPDSDWLDVRPYRMFESGDGIVVTWQDFNAHWAQRIDANGQPAWPETRRLDARMNTRLPDVVSDEMGGVLYCWWQIQNGDTMVMANRLLQDGSFAWNDSAGAVIHSGDERYREVGICSDFAGGALVIWRENDADAVAHAQYVNAQGQSQWPAEGVPLVEQSDYDYLRMITPSFITGFVDGFLAVMEDEDWETDSRIVVQKLLLDGSATWGDEGITTCHVSQNEGNLDSPTILSDQAGGVLCFYEKSSFVFPSGFQARLTRVLADGTLPWGAECSVEVALPNEYSSEIILAPPYLSQGRAQVLWLNGGYTTARTIESQRLTLETGASEFAEPLTLAVGDPAGVRDLTAAKLSNGSTVMAWNARIAGKETIQFQVMDVFGSPQLAPEGLLLSHDLQGSPLEAWGFDVTQDGTGGFFAAFRSPDNGWYHARAVHLNGQGQHISDPMGQMVLDSADWAETYEVSCIQDNAQGCYVIGTMYDNEFYLRVAVMRVNSQCEPMWDEPVVFTDPTRNVTAVKALAGDDNSCLIVYAPGEFNSIEVRAARVSGTGSVIWDTVVDPDAQSHHYDVADACSDAAGGAYVVWSTMNNAGTVYQTRMQNVSASGNLMWGDTGLIFEDSTRRASYFACDADVLGNLTVAWEEYNGQDLDVFAQRVSHSGVVQWPERGIPLSQAPRDQHSVSVIAISDNEVYVVWNDDRNVGDFYWAADVYATHLNAQGEIGDDSFWQADGSPVCNEDFDQSMHVAIHDGAGGITVAWLDQRTVTNLERSVFAQRLFDPIFTEADATPEVVTEYALAQNYPNPFNPTTTVEFALPLSGHTSLVVYDITGREVARLLDQPLEAGPYRVNFDASAFASGIYFYSLRSADFAETKKMVLLR